MSEFERFVGSGRGYSPRIAISPGAYMNLNSGAVRRFGVGAHTHVILHFAVAERLVGLQFTSDPHAPGVRKLQVRGPGRGLYMKAFCDYYGIERSKRRTYEPRWDGSLLVCGPVEVYEAAEVLAGE